MFLFQFLGQALINTVLIYIGLRVISSKL